MKTISRKFHIVAGKYPNLVRTKKKNFQRYAPQLGSKKYYRRKRALT